MRVPGLIDVGGGAGTPLVCLHGFLGCAEDFGVLFDALRDERRCIAFDLPGHGESPAPLPMTDPVFEATCELVMQWIDETLEGPFDLLGYSMGGRLAYGLLANAGVRVRRAVILGANPGLEDEEDSARRRITELPDENDAERLLAWIRESREREEA